MTTRLIEAHVELLLGYLAERLSCTVDDLKYYGCAEDIRAYGEAVAKATMAAYDAEEVTQDYPISHPQRRPT